MLARIAMTRNVSVVTLVFLLVFVFFVFSVFGEEFVEGVSVLTEESVSVEESIDESGKVFVEGAGVENLVIEDSVEEGLYAVIEEASVVGPTLIEEEKGENDGDVYVDLDEVTQDNGIEEIAEVDGEEVYLELGEVASQDSPQSDEVPAGGNAEDEEEKTQIFTGLVEVAGEIESKEIMKVNYVESQREAVSNIKRSEKTVIESVERIEKEVIVSSEEHFDGEIIYKSYFDVEVEKKEQIKLNWRNEGKEIAFETHDDNDNGLIDGISWIIPHLSVQEFEITVDLTLNEDASSSEIVIEATKFPTNVSASPVEFDFEVTYSNISSVLCNLSLSLGGNLIAVQSISNDYNYRLNLSNGNYSWTFRCVDLTNESISREIGNSFIVNANYLPSIVLSMSSLNITEGQVVSFSINLTAPSNTQVSLIKYKLNYGDGSEAYNSDVYFGQRSLFDGRTRNYTSAGSFTVNLTGSVQYVGDDFLYSVSSYGVLVVNEVLQTKDNEGPKIYLIEPEDEESFDLESREQKIKFAYNVTDNVKIANCTFEMYFYNDSLFGEEIISEFKSDISNGSMISYEYKDFDEGDYSWDVECYDNSSNKGSVSDRDFYVSYNDDESSDSEDEEDEVKKKSLALSEEEQVQVDEVQKVIDAINDFFVEEEKYAPENIEAISDLEIDETLKFYKKKLLQMKIDLGHNLDYVVEEERREVRRQEIIDEIERMKKEIPVSFEVKESKDYFKSSSQVDMEEVILAYVETKGLVVDSRGIREMAKQNELLQNQITVSVNTKSIDVRYFDGSKEEFTLVSKELSFKSREFDSLIEVIPKEVSESADEVTFVVNAKVLKKDPILEVKLDELGDRKKLVYKINKVVDLSLIEGTTTLAFKEEVPESNIGGITGFVSFVGGNWENSFGFYLSWFLVAAALLVAGVFSYRRVRISKLKKHKDVRELFAITSETERLLRVMDVEKARAKYHEAQAIYPRVPEYGKRFVYKKLQKLYFVIDKKDMTSMVKEFIAASKDGRREDALMLYGNIQRLYPRMPQGFREKAFEKMKPHLDKLKN